MIKVDGRAIAQKIIEKLKKLPKPEKVLAAVFVGENSSSASFLKIKEKIARELGINFQLQRLPKTASQEEVEEKVKELSGDAAIGGIIVQLPLPENFDREKILACVDFKKDVDTLTDLSLVEAPVVGVVKEILDWIADQDSELKKFKELTSPIIHNSKFIIRVAIVGKGILVGQPIIKWLSELKIKDQRLRIKIADSQTKNLKEFLAEADLVITGVGKAGLIKPEWLKAGAGVIDFGFPADLDQKQLVNCQLSTVNCPELAFWTPTPGGTGPVLVAKLFENFYKLC